MKNFLENCKLILKRKNQRYQVQIKEMRHEIKK